LARKRPLSATENISALAGGNFYISGLRAKIKTQALAHRRGKLQTGAAPILNFTQIGDNLAVIA